MPCFLSWSHFPKQSQGLWSNKRLLALREFRPLKEAVQIGRLNHARAHIWPTAFMGKNQVRCRMYLQNFSAGSPEGETSGSLRLWRLLTYSSHQEAPCFRLFQPLRSKEARTPQQNPLPPGWGPAITQAWGPSRNSLLPWNLSQVSLLFSSSKCPAHLPAMAATCEVVMSLVLYSPRGCILLCEMNARERPPSMLVIAATFPNFSNFGLWIRTEFKYLPCHLWARCWAVVNLNLLNVSVSNIPFNRFLLRKGD